MLPNKFVMKQFFLENIQWASAIEISQAQLTLDAEEIQMHYLYLKQMEP
jgi:hypothetical protein